MYFCQQYRGSVAISRLDSTLVSVHSVLSNCSLSHRHFVNCCLSVWFARTSCCCDVADKSQGDADAVSLAEHLHTLCFAKRNSSTDDTQGEL